MNKMLLLFPTLVTLSGCLEDNDFEYRSSGGIDTQNINVGVAAEVHTHFGDTAAEDETHTTIQVEFYGYDRDGFNFGIELAEEDQLSISIDGGEDVPVPGEASSASEDYVEYVANFELMDAGTAFSINFDRASEASVIALPVILLDETPFTATPIADSDVAMDESIVLEWLENEAYSYLIKLHMRCFEADGNTISGSRDLTGDNMTELGNPLTFSPADYYNLPVDRELSSCELHAILQSGASQDITDDTGLASAKTRITRQQSITYNVLLN